MFCTLMVGENKLQHGGAHLDGIEQAQFTIRRVVESGLPLRKTLQTVHHTAVVTRGRRSNETAGDVTMSESPELGFLADIQKDNPRIEQNEPTNV